MAKKEISRRDFIKGVAAGALGVATMGVLSACDSKSAAPAATPAAEAAAEAL